MIYNQSCMNFLAHYFFDGFLAAPYYNLGTVLPDFMGMVHRQWKLKPETLHKARKPLHKALASGMKAHLGMDDWFHKTRFFVDGRNVVKQTLINADIRYPPYRPGFLAHVMLELLLDRFIVLHYPGKVAQFYRELAKVEIPVVRNFFEEAGHPFDENFHDFLLRFVRQEYAFQYGEPIHLIKALNQISGRVGQPAITQPYQESLLRSFPELDLCIFHSFGQLFGKAYKAHNSK